MAIKIKKMGWRAALSIISFGLLLAAVIVRLFFGNSHLNISQLEKRAESIVPGPSFLVNSAHADVPYNSGEGCGCGATGGTAGEGDGDGCGGCGGCGDGSAG